MVEKKTYKAVQVQDGYDLEVAEIEIPHIKDDDILVKVEAATINPTDLLHIRGKHLRKSVIPYLAGFEGAGTAVEVGKNHASRIKVGDRVCFCSTPGTWGQYNSVPGASVFPIHPDQTFEEAANYYINPATLVLMLREVQREGHKAVIHSAGASALGKMMIRLFKENGIKTINLVRRGEVVEDLKKLGADYVLNIKDGDFEKQLEEVIKKENPTKFYDAIAGDFTAKVLRLLPPNSIISVYGILDEKIDITVTVWDLFGGKTLNSSTVYREYNLLSFEEKAKLIEYIQERLKTTLKSEIIETFSLERVKEAVAYSEEFASKGKVLLKPWE